MAGAPVRTDLFDAVPSPDDQRLQRIQDNLRTAINQLAANQDILSVPVTPLSTTGVLPAGKSIAVYAGKPGASIQLPLANSQGVNVAAVLFLLNTSSGTIAVIPAGTNTINGLKTINVLTGTFLLLVSDGSTRWLAK
jgi:hypothetical protein